MEILLYFHYKSFIFLYICAGMLLYAHSLSEEDTDDIKIMCSFRGLNCTALFVLVNITSYFC